MIVTWNSNLGSSLPSGAADEIAKRFAIHNTSLLVLLNSLYLVGYAIGPLIFGPLSEHVGRRPVLIGTHLGYTMFTMACALSPTYWLLLLFRLLCGIVAAAPNAVIGGLYADIYDDSAQRGRAVAYFIAAASMGPAFGPLISGFASHRSWNFCFWIGFILAGAPLPIILLLPETCRSVLQGKNKAECETGYQGEPGSAAAKMNFASFLARPFIMMAQEPVVLLTSLYLALVYSILYLFFQAYPIIFNGKS
jgi:multidrug resistance protein